MSKKSKIWMCIALLLCLVGAMGAFFIQTGFGQIEVSEISLRTDNGLYTGYLFVPKTASSETPAPAIVLSHGYLNNREMQDNNYVELARRGYVVFVQNAYAHGDSSMPTGEGIEVTTGGMVQGVEYVSSLSFVDNTRIGVSGHSMGGGFTDATAAYYTQLERDALAAGLSPEEARAENKIASAAIVGNYPLSLASAQDTTGESGYLCDLAVIAGKYDEFYLGMSNNYGYELLTSKETQQLVAVQTGQQLTQAAQEGQFYTNAENGYMLALYNPAETHAQNHFSTLEAADLVEFFEESLGAPNPIAPQNQVWWLKELFNMVGLIGFFAFIMPFTDLLLTLPYFAPLKAKEVLPLAAPIGKDKRRYFATNILGGIINAVLLMPLLLVGYVLLINPFWPQDTTGGIGLWTLGSGLVCLLMLRIGFGKKLKGAGKELHTKLEKGMLKRTIIMALVIIVGTYALVFLADYIFQTDFRIWTLVVRIFSAPKIWVAIKYLPFFLLFYIVNSICVSRNDIEGWSETKKISLSVAFNIIAPLLFVLVTYVPILFTQKTIFGGMPGIIGMAGALIPILVIPFVPILGIAGLISYKLYKKTGSIWLGGIVNAAMVTMITVANTSFSFPY